MAASGTVGAGFRLCLRWSMLGLTIWWDLNSPSLGPGWVVIAYLQFKSVKGCIKAVSRRVVAFEQQT